MALRMGLLSGGVTWESSVALKLLCCFTIEVSGICLHVLARSVLSWGVFAQWELVWKKVRKAKTNPALACLASH